MTTDRKNPSMQNINLTQIRPGSAIVQRDGKDIAYISRDRRLGSPNEGLWEARPVHDALTVGKSFPLFETRRESFQYIADNRWP